MKTYYSFFSKNDPLVFLKLSSATATYGGNIVFARYFHRGNFTVDLGNFNAGANTKINTMLEVSPDAVYWHFHTAFPTVSTALNHGTRGYSKYLNDIGGSYLRLRYNVYGSAKACSTYARVGIELYDEKLR